LKLSRVYAVGPTFEQQGSTPSSAFHPVTHNAYKQQPELIYDAPQRNLSYAA